MTKPFIHPPSSEPATFASANPDAKEFAGAPRGEALRRYRQVRAQSLRIAAPLSAEDCMVQSMEDASPVRWHLAHTTWFFETFLLKEQPGYTAFDPRFEFLFNSYYNSVGEQYPRSKRGMISRPNQQETCEYRAHVDRELIGRLEGSELSTDQQRILEIGLNHEQQHQELMLTDLKHALFQNPLEPAYEELTFRDHNAVDAIHWIPFEEGIVSLGHEGAGFCFDNEQPRHRVFLEPYQMADRCVTNAEFIEFMDDGGYERPEFWLSAGWDTVQSNQWSSPLYWNRENDQWTQYTLSGRVPVDSQAPVCHVSYFEADAYARWASQKWSGARLATEAEWEHAVCTGEPSADDFAGNWCDQLQASELPVHPRREGKPRFNTGLSGAFGNVWQWTSSHYSAYPGYEAAEGALGEYNGKFMCGVFVLRGGSCATPSGHIRPTYRNFFSPESRWQFSGIRLARSPR
ncbi:MAG: ergothioneine biosynthesis protein EgtB [Planctomycetota bacterium]